MFTIDVSVHLNALNPAEEGSVESQAFLEQVHRRPWPVFSPTLLLVEVAAAVARVMDDAGQGIAMAQAIRGLPGQVWVPLDDSLAEEAFRLAAERRLRGADAVYTAVARHNGTTLVTRDRQQLERLRPALPALTPAEALARLTEMAGADSHDPHPRP
jgi:predicted nucleic acid-binding protein